MTDHADTGLLAIDVGSSRVKIGWYPPTGACSTEAQGQILPITTSSFPEPADTFTVTHRDAADKTWTDGLRTWLVEHPWESAKLLIASVCPEVVADLQQVFDHQAQVLSYEEVPLEIRVEEPDGVGIDRLLTALAANRLRNPNSMAITIGVGTAITVNRIAADGAFEGGAIFPGIGMSAAALERETSALPHVAPETLAKPPLPLGKSTTQAIQSGLYWGAVGAIRQLVELFTLEAEDRPQVFVTDGDGQLIVEQLQTQGIQARYVPHMVLDGIVLVAGELS